MKRITLYLIDGTSISTETNEWGDDFIDSFKAPYRWGGDHDYYVINPQHIIKMRIETIRD